MQQITGSFWVLSALTAAEWGQFVTLLAAAGGVVYATWRKALRPALLWSTKTLSAEAFKPQLEMLMSHENGIQSLGRNQTDFYNTLNAVRESCERVESKMDQMALGMVRLEQRLDERDRQDQLHGRYKR